MTSRPEQVESAINRRWRVRAVESDLSKGDVRLTDDYLVANQLTVDLEGVKNHPDVTVEVVVDDATHWRVTSLTVRSESLFRATVSDVLVSDLATALVAYCAMGRVSGQSDKFSMVPNTANIPLMNFLRHRQRRGRVIDLEEVASIYKEALATGDAPTLAVSVKLDIGRSTAARHVKHARDAGLLPPTSQGKAQA